METLFDHLLSVVAEAAPAFPERAVTLFSSRRGFRYNHELVLVGRAVNGWLDSYEPERFASDLARRNAINRLLAPDPNCPLRWVIDLWPELPGPRRFEVYSTKRSAFWRTAREITFGLTNASEHDWSSHLAWSNLYKVSPFEKGNPSAVLAARQLPFATEILEEELRALQPRRVFFCTGMNWAHPFLRSASFDLRPSPGSTYVEAVGYATFGGLDSRICVAQHPQGKHESTFVSEVLTAFEHLH